MMVLAMVYLVLVVKLTEAGTFVSRLVYFFF